MKRRDFLRISAGSALLGASALTAGCGGLPVLAGVLRDGRIRVSLADVESAAGDGSAVGVDVGTTYPVLLVRGPDGAFHAASSRCTHQACRVKPGREFFVCPCHGSTFRLDGEVVRGPAQTPLETYRVTALGDVVEIDLGRGA